MRWSLVALGPWYLAVRVPARSRDLNVIRDQGVKNPGVVASTRLKSSFLLPFAAIPLIPIAQHPYEINRINGFRPSVRRGRVMESELLIPDGWTSVRRFDL